MDRLLVITMHSGKQFTFVGDSAVQADKDIDVALRYGDRVIDLDWDSYKVRLFTRHIEAIVKQGKGWEE